MRKSLLWAATVVLFSLILATALARSPDAAPGESAASKWEYKVVALAAADLDPERNGAAFNELGVAGWELCATLSTTSGKGPPVATIIFKRPAR